MNKKPILLTAGLAIILTAAVLLTITLRGNNNDEGNNNVETPAVNINSFAECIEAGYPALESYPRQCKTDSGQSFTEEVGNEQQYADLIRLTSPKANQEISSPLQITGQARGQWYFEASFPARLTDANGKELAAGPMTAQGEWMTTEFVPFKGTLTFQTPTTPTGYLILERDNASGLPENDAEIKIPVKFTTYNQGQTNVKVYFNNQGNECEKVVSTERSITKTAAIARASIEELLKGPTTEEKNKGFTTSINSGVKINSLVIDKGVAKIDLSKEVDQNVAGSCRVSAIRAQITETLKQFPTVNLVNITVEGKEDTLQP